MEKAYSEIVGMPVTVDGSGKAGRVTDVLVDPLDGRVAAFFTGRMKIISPMDIIFFGRAITIGNYDDVIDVDDLVKVQDIIKRDVRLLKSDVQTQKGDYLGKIYNYYIDVGAYGLTKIVVYKSFFGILKSPERIIPARDIVKIEKNLVTVKNKHAKQPVAAEEDSNVKELYPDIA